MDISDKDIRLTAKLMLEHHGSYKAATDNNQGAIKLALASGDNGAVHTFNRIQIELDKSK